MSQSHIGGVSFGREFLAKVAAGGAGALMFAGPVIGGLRRGALPAI